MHRQNFRRGFRLAALAHYEELVAIVAEVRGLHAAPGAGLGPARRASTACSLVTHIVTPHIIVAFEPNQFCRLVPLACLRGGMEQVI